jgi:hypothetical protein
VLLHQRIDINKEEGGRHAIAQFGVKVRLISVKRKYFIAGPDNSVNYEMK